MMTKLILDQHGNILRTLNAPVPLNKRPVKRGTLKSILTLLEITEEEFERAVR